MGLCLLVHVANRILIFCDCSNFNHCYLQYAIFTENDYAIVPNLVLAYGTALLSHSTNMTTNVLRLKQICYYPITFCLTCSNRNLVNPLVKWFAHWFVVLIRWNSICPGFIIEQNQWYFILMCLVRAVIKGPLLLARFWVPVLSSQALKHETFHLYLGSSSCTVLSLASLLTLNLTRLERVQCIQTLG